VKGLLVLKSAIPLRQLIATCTTKFEKINGTVSSACFKIQAGEGRGVQLEMLIMLQLKRRTWDCTNLCMPSGTTPSMPYNVRKVRMKRMMYPGITIW
jgi:hypothetical protein